MVPAASDYSVFVPAVSYIDTEGLDPNADDETLIQQFLDKIKEIPFYKKTKKSSFPKFLQALLIRMCIEYAKDTENAARGLEFTLLHELGHVFHHHSKNHAKLNQKYENGSSKYLNNISLGLLKKIEEIKQSKKHETEADEFAMKTNSRGAIHLFTFLTEFSKQQRKLKKGRILQSLACRVLFSPKGNNRSFYLSHPSEILR
ncbi:MAG: hypothetical protein CMO81_06780 [Waddliaceae bacterium]|nr:hypothetical protein [Waddliaceae bacterium]